MLWDENIISRIVNVDGFSNIVTHWLSETFLNLISLLLIYEKCVISHSYVHYQVLTLTSIKTS